MATEAKQPVKKKYKVLKHFKGNKVGSTIEMFPRQAASLVAGGSLWPDDVKMPEKKAEDTTKATDTKTDTGAK